MGCSNTPPLAYKRGLGEEVYLQSLIDRVQSQYEPHREPEKSIHLRGIEGFVQKVLI